MAWPRALTQENHLGLSRYFPSLPVRPVHQYLHGSISRRTQNGAYIHVGQSSTAAIGSHPIQAMLVSYSIVFLGAAFATDLPSEAPATISERFLVLLLTVGVIMGSFMLG
jgi:hypothetical protein